MGVCSEYYEQNQVVPTVNLVKEKFIDFEPQVEVGATKHHLDELRQDFLRDNLRNTLRTAATAVQDGETVEALDQLIADAAELKRVTSEVRDLDVSDIDNALDYFEQVRLLNESGSHGIRTGLPGFDNYLPQASHQDSWVCFLPTLPLVSLGLLSTWQHKPGCRDAHHSLSQWR